MGDSVSIVSKGERLLQGTVIPASPEPPESSIGVGDHRIVDAAATTPLSLVVAKPT